MTKVFDDEVVAQAFRDAERALAARDPDTLAGRFSPKPLGEERQLSGEKARASTPESRLKRSA